MQVELVAGKRKGGVMDANEAYARGCSIAYAQGLEQELAKLREELADATKNLNEWRESCIDANQRFETAEAELAKLREQEPVAWCYGVSNGDICGVTLYKDNPALEPLYAAPMPTKDKE